MSIIVLILDDEQGHFLYRANHRRFYAGIGFSTPGR